MFKYCSTSKPVSLSAKICNDACLALSLSLSESSRTKFGHSLAKRSYSPHLKHLTLSLFVLALEFDLDLKLKSDLVLIPLSLDLDCLQGLLSSLFLSLLLFLLKLPLFYLRTTSSKITSTSSIISITVVISFPTK